MQYLLEKVRTLSYYRKLFKIRFLLPRTCFYPLKHHSAPKLVPMVFNGGKDYRLSFSFAGNRKLGKRSNPAINIQTNISLNCITSYFNNISLVIFQLLLYIVYIFA